MTLEFQTVVVGSGPAGIAAAVCAAEHGQKVGLVDDNPSAGGQMWRKGIVASHHSPSAERWRARLEAVPISRLQGWSVFDSSSPQMLHAERGSDVVDIRFENLILATGARERFLPFPGWTLPNVMGVGALQAMVKRGLPVRGKRIVVAGSGPLLIAVAASLKTSGAEVVCICEQASATQLLPFALALAATPSKIIEGLSYRSATWSTPFHTSSWPVAASGDGRLHSATLSIQGRITNIQCDYLACAFHLVPNTELAALIGCKIEQGRVSVDGWQQTSVSSIYCAGEPTGIGGLELSLIEGQIAGLAAAGQHGKAQGLFPKRQKQLRFAARLAKAFALRSELKSLPTDDTLLCRCEDVAYGTVRQHASWCSAKLQTRCGMGPCQGRICGVATEFLLGYGPDSIRSPILPARISSLARAARLPKSNATMQENPEGDQE